jgi:transcriptional regulator with XRE-family HTH domain
MSPRRRAVEPPAAAAAARDRLTGTLATRIHDERIRRRWSIQKLAGEAGLGKTEIYAAEAGETLSIDAYCRIAAAFSLRPEFELLDPKKRDRPARAEDPVHAAMGELEAARLSSFGFSVGMDEPYQHYQFAGRADLIAWDVDRRALLHIENRTRFPNVQEAIGAWNQKREYMPRVLAARFGVRSWLSVTHVMAALWSAEVLHVLRIRKETFHAVCPNGPDAFESWWHGESPASGTSATLIVLDPKASWRQRLYASGDEIAIAKPRHRGYADAAKRLNA